MKLGKLEKSELFSRTHTCRKDMMEHSEDENSYTIIYRDLLSINYRCHAHTAAMDLLVHGVDRSVIALWLGHESVDTTEMYIHANLKMKELALEKTKPLDVKTGRYQPDDHILAFLKSL